MGVRGVSPFNGSGPAAPFNGSGTAARPRSSSKSITPNRGTGVFRNELRKCVRTSHGRFVFCEERGGDRSIGGANLRKGAALQRKRPRRPLQWPARPVPGRRTLHPTRQTGRFCAMQGVNFLNQPQWGDSLFRKNFSGWELSFPASFSGGRFEPRPTLIFRGFCFPLRGGGRCQIYYVERNRAVALDFYQDF